MRVCDICRKEIKNPITIRIDDGIFSYKYELCRKCERKIERSLEFEQARHSKKERD